MISFFFLPSSFPWIALFRIRREKDILLKGCTQVPISVAKSVMELQFDFKAIPVPDSVSAFRRD
jgi:hypothetical protein